MKRLKSKIAIEKWQLMFLFIGFLLIVAGLVIIILWQRGFVQLKWLQCPDYNVPFV